MKRIALSILFIFISLTSLMASRSSDFEYMKNTIASLHKDFYNSVSKADADTKYNELSRNVDEMDEAEFYFTLSSYLALSHDSHTSLSSQDIWQHFLYIPIQLNFIGEKLYGVSGRAEYASLLAKEVIRINDMSVSEAVKRGASAVPHDNEVYLRLWLGGQLNNTAFLCFIGAAGDKTSPVRLTFSDGTEALLEPMDAMTLRSGKIVSAVKSYPEYIHQGYYAVRDLGNKAILISYNTCSEDPSYPIKEFTEEIKKTIKEVKPEKIIVDLRYNGGGNSALFDPIIKVLKKQKCGKYCLIGENTFSSAILNAVSLKDHAGFRLVGSPTGGSINHYGELKSFTLPDTGWEVYYSTKFFKMSRKYDGPIRPDIIIERTIEDFVSGHDAGMAYCLSEK